MLARFFTHLFAARGLRARWFDDATLAAIRNNIAEGERAHAGEIVFVVESRLSIADVIDGVDARTRAEHVFATQRVWDTEANTGVLVYVLLAEHRVEIVADRGIAARVDPAVWAALCGTLAESFREGRARDGVLSVLDAIHAACRTHFPATRDDVDELPNRPVML